MIEDDSQDGRFPAPDEGDEGDGGSRTFAPVAAVNAMALIQEREINQQVATARRYPRDLRGFVGSTKSLVIQDEETAMECIYALPKRRGSDNEIVGPSVRFAELVGSCWGNSRYASRIVDEGQQFVTAQAVFQDLERNIAVSVEVQRRIVGTTGRRYGVDMIGVTSAAAMSIALRNAILKGIPGPMWKPAYSAAMALIAGSFESVEKRRIAALKAYATMGFEEPLVLEMLGLSRAEQIEPKHMLILRGTLTALRDGDTTAGQVFGNLPSRQAKRQGIADRGNLETRIQSGKQSTETRVGGNDGDSASGQSGKGETSAGSGDRASRDRPVDAPLQGADGDSPVGGASSGRTDAAPKEAGASEGGAGQPEGTGTVPQGDDDGVGEGHGSDPASEQHKPSMGADDGRAREQSDAIATGPDLPPGEWKPNERKLFGNINRDLAKATKAIEVSDVEESYRGSIEVKGEAFKAAAMALIRARADSFKAPSRRSQL